MFNIEEKDIIGQTNKLLYNIWHELKLINKEPQKDKKGGANNDSKTNKQRK